jgi:hypothetical protein
MNKYQRTIYGSLADGKRQSVIIDVYDVLVAFDVSCPATSHAIKKLLCAGSRGHKDETQDLEEAGQAIRRAIELSKQGAG